MRFVIFSLLVFSTSIFYAQERMVFLTGTDSTLIVDGKSLQMQSKSQGLFVGRFAGFREDSQPGNTSIGYSAGYQNLNGSHNTLLGFQTGFSNVAGSDNVYIGSYTADLTQGSRNVALGKQAFRVSSGNKVTAVGYEAASDSRDQGELVAIGYQSGFQTRGQAGTFVGFQAGYNNETGNNLTAVGHSSGYANTTGINNTFLGVNSGYKNSTAGGNTFVGSFSGWENTGPENTFMGVSAGANNTGSKNIMIGYTAGLFSNNGAENVFVGHNSARNNSSGKNNVFLGFEAGLHNRSGDENVAIGSGALLNAASSTSSQDPNFSVAVGFEAGRQSSGDNNTFLGYSSGSNNGNGTGNVYVGRNSGTNSSGDRNTFLGSYTGVNNGSGSNNVYIGYNVGTDKNNSHGNIHIGHNIQGLGEDGEFLVDNSNTSQHLLQGNFDQDHLTVNGIYRVQYSVNESFPTEGAGLYLHHDPSRRLGIINSLDYSIPNSIQGELLLRACTSVGLYVNQTGYGLKLPTTIISGNAIARSWDTYSDARIKSNIKPLNYGLSSILALRPVSYDQHGRNANSKKVTRSLESNPEIGLVAQEVYKIVPEAVNKPKNEAEELWTMDYERLIPVLIKSIQELKEQLDDLEKQVENCAKNE